MAKACAHLGNQRRQFRKNNVSASFQVLKQENETGGLDLISVHQSCFQSFLSSDTKPICTDIIFHTSQLQKYLTRSW